MFAILWVTIFLLCSTDRFCNIPRRGLWITCQPFSQTQSEKCFSYVLIMIVFIFCSIFCSILKLLTFEVSPSTLQDPCWQGVHLAYGCILCVQQLLIYDLLKRSKNKKIFHGRNHIILCSLHFAREFLPCGVCVYNSVMNISVLIVLPLLSTTCQSQCLAWLRFSFFFIFFFV